MAKPQVTPHDPVRHAQLGHFAEDAAYRVFRPHGSGDHLLIATISGRGRVLHEDAALAVEKGDLILWAPEAAQDYGTDPRGERWELRWAHFQPRPHWQPWLNWPSVGPGIRRLRIDDRPAWTSIRVALSEAHRHHVGQLPDADAFAMNALERALLWCDRVNPESAGRPIDDRVQKAIDHLSDRFDQPHSIEQLAAHVALSPSRLSHLFKEQIGITPMRMLERQRIERAKQLLEQTAQPIQTIADRVGFDSPYYFSLRFKKATGQSPRAYRQSIR